MTFQMKVFLYKNKDLLKQHKKYVLEDQKKAAAEKTKKLLELSMSHLP